MEYVKHQMSTPRPSDGAPDLGAFERASAVSVDPLPRGAVALATYPNPFATRCDIRQVGGALETFSLEVFDTRGRLMTRIPAVSPGCWTLRPAATWPNGLYFVRGAGGLRRRVVLLR
jgi:hypothetical protein